MRMLQLTLATAAGTEFTNEGTIGLENLTRCETETERNETRACVYKFFNSVRGERGAGGVMCKYKARASVRCHR